jgi:hypothetical protein
MRQGTHKICTPHTIFTVCFVKHSNITTPLILKVEELSLIILSNSPISQIKNRKYQFHWCIWESS